MSKFAVGQKVVAKRDTIHLKAGQIYEVSEIDGGYLHVSEVGNSGAYPEVEFRALTPAEAAELVHNAATGSTEQ